MTEGVDPASFRDPSGFVYRHGGVLHRQVNRRFAEDYRALIDSGLYGRLVDQGLLCPHEEVAPPAAPDADHFCTLRPEEIAFLSHPYEWCFSQLQEAALTTLRLQCEALRCGMVLKDASAYNIQFQRGRAVCIDTLSFRRLREGEPWVAYRQFCQHFLAPLALMSRVDVRLAQLLRVHLDGIPLDLAARLLPLRARLRPGLFVHLDLHARLQGRHAAAADATPAAARRIDRRALQGIAESLERCVRRLAWNPPRSEWSDYYAGDSYEAESFESRRAAVERHLAALAPRSVWDLGANTGRMSRLAAARCEMVVAFDLDASCVEANWHQVRERGEQNLLPLVLDLANPSPALGWAQQERRGLFERSGPDALMALALIHHIAIGNNVPLQRIAEAFARLAPALLIEFVPKSDAKVALLLASREDVFPDYTQAGFEAAFAARWRIEQREAIPGSERTLYRMRRLETPR